jgi:protein transport protein SEC61 subunit alpha
MKALDVVTPFLGFLPEVARPKKMPGIKDRIMWTAVALFIFLICCQVPVYGSRPTKTSDPFYWMRVVLASNKGTLMELGISPMITSNLILELLAGVGVISVNQNDRRERANFEGAQKIFALVITLIEAVAYVSSGMYGNVADIGFFTCALIVGQLMIATTICLLLDELLQKGWGLGSGSTLFIATNICDTIIWKSFSPTTINTGRGTEFEGAVIAFFHLLISRNDKVRALREAFYRPQLPNVVNLLSTLAIFLIVVFLQGFHVNLATVRRSPPAPAEPFQIKLFYTSNMPIILQTSVISNFNFFSQILYRRFSNNFLVSLLGKWETREYSSSGQMYPVGGLAYYITAPHTITDMFNDPIHAIFYITFVLVMCAMFSKVWIGVQRTAPRDMAKKLLAEGKRLKQYRDNEDDIAVALNRYIPTAAAFGGLCIGALTILADFLGAIGSGTGILLAVTMIHQYHEVLQREGQELGLDFLKRKATFA